MVIVSWSVYGAMWQWLLCHGQFMEPCDNGYCVMVSLWSHVTMVIVSWSVYGAMWQWLLCHGQFMEPCDNGYCVMVSLWSHVTMVIVSWSVYGAMRQWPILVAKVELCFDGWNFTWIRKFVKKNRFLRNLGKNTSEPIPILKNISCFRIIMLFPNCWRK